MDENREAPIEALQQAIRDLHGAESTFVEAVEVKEVFQGAVVWQGAVQVFDLTAPVFDDALDVSRPGSHAEGSLMQGKKA